MPELINSTNLLRSNEILTKTNEKKTELLDAYESYFKELENVLKKIQRGLSTLKTQTKNKSRKKQITIRRKKKSKRKTRKKTRSRKKHRKKSFRRKR